MFQSLIGLKINWNLIKGGYLKIVDKFQSLIGLKINWNIDTISTNVSLVLVSIPNRA